MTSTATHELLEAGLLQLCENNCTPAADGAAAQLLKPRLREILALLEKYIAEIERFNPVLKLVGTTDRQGLIVRHILDSLAPLEIVARQLNGNLPRIADAGSGAGLPGIPLAIVLPQAQVTLIEKMGRRTGFLRNAQAALGLSNISIEEGELEKAAPGRFSLVVFRALKPLEPEILRRLFRLCAPGGALAAYKGRREKIEAEMSALERLCEQKNRRFRWELIPCAVPFLNEERHIVLIRNPLP
jgi:16S rRNA (guanine527-N7)-methyltransferase